MTVSLTHSTPADGTFSATGATAWDAQHVLTQDTARLLGRTTAGVGATEEISVGTGLSLSSGTLTNTVAATTPGGSDTQIQFNNAGAFGGASGLTTNGTELTIASGTNTASAPVLNMSQTWNNSGVTFTGLRFNATDTASAAASLLMDLQVGGTSFFSVTKAARAQFSSARLRLGAADAAAPVAQTLSVQSVVAGTSNTAGQPFTITGSQGTGTGAGGSIIFQVAPAGSTGTAQNALADALTIASTRAATFADTVTATSLSGFIIAGAGAASSFYKAGSGGSSGIRVGSTTTAFFQSNGRISGLSFGISDSSSNLSSGTVDVIFERDAANTLALRNGTNAQTFNVYNTFTSSTNFERFRIFAQSAAAVLIGTQKGSGGGTARALELQTDATSRLTLDTVGSAQIVTALTVATLPATPLTGMIARVTDALAPAVGVTVAAGGAAQALCWYNGANWTVIGV